MNPRRTLPELRAMSLVFRRIVTHSYVIAVELGRIPPPTSDPTLELMLEELELAVSKGRAPFSVHPDELRRSAVLVEFFQLRAEALLEHATQLELFFEQAP